MGHQDLPARIRCAPEHISAHPRRLSRRPSGIPVPVITGCNPATDFYLAVFAADLPGSDTSFSQQGALL
jgi:hypothetical protein